MKETTISPKLLYSTTEVALLKRKNKRTITDRAHARNIIPHRKQGVKGFYFTEEQIEEMFSEKVNGCPEIIYVNRTTEIIHSKLNFNQLHEL